MTDLFSALVEWNIVLRQAGWIIPALIQVIFNRGTITRARVIEIFLLYNIGVGGMITATSIIFHTLFADQTAESIGWAAGNPFQMEVGVASLAIGIVGFFGFWRRDFWLPYIISKSIFAWGAGLVHVADILENANFSPGNAGAILYADFILPFISIALYILYHRSQADHTTMQKARSTS
jgi:hypothetical protein